MPDRFLGKGAGHPTCRCTDLAQLREQPAARTEQAAPAPWADRLPELAARPLSGNPAGTVIA